MDKKLERYQRQMMLPDLGKDGQCRLLRSSAAVIGAGGLGSAVLMYLAAAGVGRLVIFDCDRVELSNLNRQVLYSEEDAGQYKAAAAHRFLSRFNSGIEIEHYIEPVAESAFDFSKVDIIIDATDNFETRYYLNRLSIKHGKPFIYGSVYGREGRVAAFQPGETACFRCLYPGGKNNIQKPVLGACTGATGSIQASEAVSYLADGRLALAGKLLVFDLYDMSFEKILIPRDETCIDCRR